MKIRVHTAILAAVLGALSLSPASAFFDDTRPPPNGMNGLSLNGLSANGLSANGYTVGTVTIRAVVLKDGSRVDLP